MSDQSLRTQPAVLSYLEVVFSCVCGWQHRFAASAGETPITCPQCHTRWVMASQAPAVTVETFRYRCAKCGTINSAPCREGGVVTCVGCQTVSMTAYDERVGTIVAATTLQRTPTKGVPQP